LAAERMIKAAADFPAPTKLQKQALDQLGRELLLAQASDWPFIINSGTMVQYARQRAEDHLSNFLRLHEQLYGHRLDPDWLSRLQEKDNIFPDLDYRVFTPQTLTEQVPATLADPAGS